MRFVAGRGAVAELLAEGAAAKSHREDVAGRGAVAERWYGQPAEAAGRAPWRRDWQRRCEAPSGRRCPQGDALRIRIGKMLMTGSGTRKQHREATPPRKAAGKREAASVDF